MVFLGTLVALSAVLSVTLRTPTSPRLPSRQGTVCRHSGAIGGHAANYTGKTDEAGRGFS